MAFIDWTDKNMVGIAEVDEQHKELFEMLNRLHASVTGGQERSVLHSVLDNLIEYTVYHFNTEEVLFDACEYPLAQEHKKEHDRLTAQALDLQRELREGSATISFEVLEFLHDWLMDHTSGLDMEFAQYLRENDIYFE